MEKHIHSFFLYLKIMGLFLPMFLLYHAKATCQNLVINPYFGEYTGTGKPCLGLIHDIAMLDNFPGWNFRFSAGMPCVDCPNKNAGKFKIYPDIPQIINPGAYRTRQAAAYFGNTAIEIEVLPVHLEALYLTGIPAYSSAISGGLSTATTKGKTYFFSVWLSPSYANNIRYEKTNKDIINYHETFITSDFGIDLWSADSLNQFMDLKGIDKLKLSYEFLDSLQLEAVNPAHNLIQGNADSHWVELRMKFTATQSAPNFVFGLFPTAIRRPRTLVRNPYSVYNPQNKDNWFESFCYYADAFTLMPYPELGDTLYVPEGDSLVLDPQTPGADLLWFDGTTGLNNTIYCPGTYWVESRSQFTSVRDSVVVLAKKKPWPADTVLCYPKPNLAISPKAYNILWSTGQTTHQIQPQTAGAYSVHFTMPGGCTFQKETTVSFDSLIWLPPVDTTVCDTLKLTLQDGLHYSWSTGDTARNMVLTESGDYTITASNLRCSVTEQFRLEVENPIRLTVHDSILCQGESFVFDPPIPFPWQWVGDVPEQPIRDSADLVLEWKQPHCGLQGDTFLVRFKNCACDVWVPNAFSPNGDGLNDAFLTVSLCALEDYELRIYNRWGEIVFTSIDPNLGWEGQELLAGVYYYTISFRPMQNHQFSFLYGTVHVVK